jgi:hypothetical protein
MSRRQLETATALLRAPPTRPSSEFACCSSHLRPATTRTETDLQDRRCRPSTKLRPFRRRRRSRSIAPAIRSVTSAFSLLVSDRRLRLPAGVAAPISIFGGASSATVPEASTGPIARGQDSRKRGGAGIGENPMSRSAKRAARASSRSFLARTPSSIRGEKLSCRTSPTGLRCVQSDRADEPKCRSICLASSGGATAVSPSE